MLIYRAEFDLALTYALRRPELALECAFEALKAAVIMGRTDLTRNARGLIRAIGGGQW